LRARLDSLVGGRRVASTNAVKDDLLRIYLNDHLAGSAAARALARRVARENSGSPLGTLLGEFVRELETERSVVLDLLGAVAGRENEVKQAAGWLLEKLGRLKLNGKLVGYSDLSRLLELEGLLSGIHGKLLLWRAMERLSAFDERLRVADFAALAERAERQLASFEEQRLVAAETAFAPAGQSLKTG
jgi:hypothetical protein